ncbi:hypothetical protein MNBD_ALPHA06-955 [hydrothermal vent metagenome]|uniref:TMEM205-like domain-containing protein n=1 Tax=hydrothermal vent metagenome TaxID=652676 RepID=A0A3B0R4T5_9ZZZZ
MTSFALILTASIIGAMTFFAFFVAPAAAKAGSSTMVLALSRAVFPRAFDLFAMLSVVAALASSLAHNALAAACLVLATCVFLFAGWKITPELENARDAARAGNQAALLVFAKSRSSAVTANALQYISLIAAVVFLTL